jgi:hypothetical protein
MAKKASKSKAKQSRAKQRPRMLKEFQLDIFGGRKLVATRPVPTKAELLASAEFTRKAEEYFASEEFRQRKASEAAATVRHRERIERRPAEMKRRGYRLPDDVYTFLDRLYRDWLCFDAPVWQQGEPPLPVDAVSELMEAAYMEGCRQGFVEGFVERRMPDKKRSDTGNAAKRKTLVELPDGRRMTRDERDTLMVVEYESLLTLKLKPTPAMERLAEKYGFESWQGVAAAMKSFGKRSAR